MNKGILEMKGVKLSRGGGEGNCYHSLIQKGQEGPKKNNRCDREIKAIGGVLVIIGKEETGKKLPSKGKERRGSCGREKKKKRGILPSGDKRCHVRSKTSKNHTEERRIP